MYTFIGLLLSYLDAHGIPHTADVDNEYDILFVNSWVVPYDTVKRVKTTRPGVRIVHRVDGSSMDYGGYRSGDARQARVNLLADLTVFQSRYSKLSTTTKFHVIGQDGPIIYNPVDLELFRPEGPRLRFAPERVPVACASWSTNERKGTRDLDRLAAEHPEVDFVLCGRFEGLTLRPNLIHLGHASRSAIASAFRSCAAFLNLSDNDPAPNVVIEAMASGVPVLYRDSGGVPELVGDCGLPVTADSFRSVLDDIRSRHESLAGAARERATRLFSPAVIFPQYLASMERVSRRPPPGLRTFLRSAVRGFPVISLPRRSAASPARPARAARRASSPARVGWLTYDPFLKGKKDLDDLDSFTGMRAGSMARWMNANSDRFRHEVYDPEQTYDVVVFQKMMNRRCQREVERLQAAGTAVVFDANVNYYEIWGDYPVPGTQPTAEQQRDAIWMTRNCDWVVADSSYLASVARKFAAGVTWIPDNVDPRVYEGSKRHENRGPLELVWSGIGKKAAHLDLIKEVLGQLPCVELVLVCDDPSAPEIRAIAGGVPARVLPFSDREYARTLLECDVIVSPKFLTNGYEMAHTEYKITLGMAMGLPAVASPQPSYVEAITHLGGGIVARTPHEWREALEQLAANPSQRAAMGELGQRTVRERYATPVVGRQYLDLLGEVLARVQLKGAAASC